MDSGRFDEFTRLLGMGISRRTLLRGIAGSAAIAAVGGQIPPLVYAEKKVKPSKRVYTCSDGAVSSEICPYPPTNSPFDAATCRVGGGRIFQTKQATYNGLCDVPWVNNQDSLEGLRDRYNKASWESACEAHDCCYNTCGTSQSDCDSLFLEAMIDACVAAYPSSWSKPNQKLRQLDCAETAALYYVAVAQPLNGSHRNAQEQNCECCIQDPGDIVVTPVTTPTITPAPEPTEAATEPAPEPTEAATEPAATVTIIAEDTPTPPPVTGIPRVIAIDFSCNGDVAFSVSETSSIITGQSQVVVNTVTVDGGTDISGTLFMPLTNGQADYAFTFPFSEFWPTGELLVAKAYTDDPTIVTTSVSKTC